MVGVLAKDTVEEYLRDPLSIGWFLIVTGTVLWLSEYLGSRQRGFERLNTRDAVVVGVSQISALLPGISRSGVTLATGLFRGLNRETAARFSYLLGTPNHLGCRCLAGLGSDPGRWLVFRLGRPFRWRDYLRRGRIFYYQNVSCSIASGWVATDDCLLLGGRSGDGCSSLY